MGAVGHGFYLSLCGGSLAVFKRAVKARRKLRQAHIVEVAIRVVRRKVRAQQRG
jgi:hypothetical protein